MGNQNLSAARQGSKGYYFAFVGMVGAEGIHHVFVCFVSGVLIPVVFGSVVAVPHLGLEQHGRRSLKGDVIPEFLKCSKFFVVFGNIVKDRDSTPNEWLDEENEIRKTLPKMIDVCMGIDMTIALAEDGSVYCCGTGQYGKNGDATTNQYSLFTKVKYIDNAVSVTGTDHSNGALDSDGTIWMWGLNGRGRCGTNWDYYHNRTGEANSYYAEPVHTRSKDNSNNLRHVIDFVSSRVSIVKLEDKTALDWGWGSNGELGNGTTGVYPLPIDVKLYDPETDTYTLAENIKQITVNHVETNLVLENGEAWATGYNGR